MLRQLMSKLHKLSLGAVKLTAPKVTDVTSEPNLSIEDLIRYPPETKGIPIIKLDKIMASQAEILRLMHRDSGLLDPQDDSMIKSSKANKRGKPSNELDLNFDTLFRQVVVNYIRYVHLLPASENHHHCDVGGLIRHSLEVALNSLRKSQQQVLPAIGHLDEEQNRKPRWQYAAWVCGLLHDAGKVLYDMRVYDTETGKDWNPYLSDLYTWASENNVSRYRVVWRPEHRHKKHENLSVTVLEWVLTKEAKAYLMDNTDELPIAMNHCLSHYGNTQGFLQNCLRAADSASTEKDIQTQWHEMIGKRRYPLESAIVNAMRRLRDEWTVNEAKAFVWIIGDEVFLSWPKAIQMIVKRLQDDKVDVPVNPTRVVEILEERNLVKKLDQTANYSMFTPKGIKNITSPERVICLSWPGLLYETMPTPKSIPGTLRLNNEGKALEYNPDGTITLIESESETNSEERAPVTVGVKPKAESETSIVETKSANESVTRMAKSTPVKKTTKAVQENDKQAKAIKSSNNKPSSDLGNKGLSFVNQATASTGAKPSKSEDANQPAKDISKSSPEKTQPAKPRPNDKEQSNKAAKQVAPKEVVEAKAKASNIKLACEEETKPSKKEQADKKGGKDVIGSMLRNKRAAIQSQAQQVAQVEKKGWLKRSVDTANSGELAIKGVCVALSSGDIKLDLGEHVFLRNSLLYISAVYIADTLKLDVGEVTTDLKLNKLLKYDLLKPNQLVKRESFGKQTVMCVCLTKKLTTELLNELGLTVSSINYSQLGEEKSKPQVNHGEKVSEDAQVPNTKGSSSTAVEPPNITSEFLEYLTNMVMGEALPEFIKHSEKGSFYAVQLNEAISGFGDAIPDKEKLILKKEIPTLAVGTEKHLNSKGEQSRYLLLEKHIIG